MKLIRCENNDEIIVLDNIFYIKKHDHNVDLPETMSEILPPKYQILFSIAPDRCVSWSYDTEELRDATLNEIFEMLS